MASEKKEVDEWSPLSGAGGEPKDTEPASTLGSKYKRSKEDLCFPSSSSSSIKTPKSTKAKKAKAPRSMKAADVTVHKAKKEHAKAPKTKSLKKKFKQTETPSTLTREASPPSSAASSPSLTALKAPCTGDSAALTARTGITRSPKVLPETAPSAIHQEAHSMDLQTRMALAEWQQQKAAALGGSLWGGDHPPHSTARVGVGASVRPQDTKELLALAAVADADCGSMQHLLAARAAAMAGGGLRQSEMMEHEMALAAAAANRNHMEHLQGLEIALQHKVRMEQELMAAAHQQQAHHQAQSVHNMAVNALVSGVSVEEVMVRSGLPRDLALEVARRMIALSQASAGGTQNSHSLSAAAARHWAAAEAQNDSLTMAMIREQTILQQQQLQNAAFRLRGGPLP